MLSLYEAAQAKFDPRYNQTEEQIRVFGEDRLAADVDNLATFGTTQELTGLVIGATADLEIEPRPAGYFRRVLDPNPGKPNNSSLYLGYNPYPENFSFIDERAVAFVQNIAHGTEVPRRNGLPRTEFTFFENMFVQAGNEVPFISRTMTSSPLFTWLAKPMTVFALKAASEGEVRALIDRTKILIDAQEAYNEQELQKIIKHSKQWWRRRKK
jgi:hypothetical protein